MMAALFDSVATSLSLTKGQNWHYGHIPDGLQGTASVLMERVGLPRDQNRSQDRWYRYQVLTRADTYRTAEAEARRIFDHIVALRGVQLDGWYLYDATGSEPACVGQNEKGQWLFSANITVSTKKES